MSASQIRTLHILDCLHRRGAETFAVQMIDRLDRDRFAPHIWATRPGPEGRSIVPARTPVLSGETAPSAAAGSMRELAGVVRRVRPHVIQCHGARPLKYALAVKPFARAEAYVYNKIQSVQPLLAHPFKLAVYRRLIEQVDAVVAVGEQVRREVETVFQPRRPRLLTISNGRDVAPFESMRPEEAAARRRELGLDADQICLMAVGSLSAEKDPLFLLDLCADLVTDHPALTLAFVGEGPLEAALRAEVERRGLQRYVRFLGVRADVPQLVAAADVVLLPSVVEGLPGALIEAGMAGRPSVAFRVGSVDDVLKDGATGYTVPPGDRRLFRRRVAELIQDRARRTQMGAAALVYCRTQFDIVRSVRQYEELFVDLVQRARIRGPQDAQPFAGMAGESR